MAAVSVGGGSSRDSVQGAGWNCPAGQFPHPDRRPFSWLNASTLWHSRNDVIAHHIDDPTDDERRRWLAAMYPHGVPDLTIDRTEPEEVSFLIVGDPGEGDASQFAVVPQLLANADTQFMFICSDVIYPAGGVGEYEEKFFRPYKDYPAPIYAVPGNHDWYDNLTGFMFHFCGRNDPPASDKSPRMLTRAWLREHLWRRPSPPEPAQIARMRAMRAAPAQHARLPGPYFVVDTGPLQLVGIDTGIRGNIDRDQGEWLVAVSRSDKPKILMTGKPLIVDGVSHPCPIEGGGNVDALVRDPANRYVAAIGGDIHNYQRYPVRVGNRTIQYIVSGGGGAFMHATHKIPRVVLPGCDENQFRCYPLRGDSLSFYSQAYEKRIPFSRGRYFIDPIQAAAYMAQRIGIAATKPDARDVGITKRTRRSAERIFPHRGQHATGFLQPIFSEFFDWNDPPLFKSFLRVDASSREIRIRCIAATGCVGDDKREPEDEFIAVSTDGDYVWTAL